MRVRDRAWLVCLVAGMETPRKAAARILRKRARWARKWPRRHREGGLAALPGLPWPGRPRAVGCGRLRKVMGRVSEPLATPDRARFMVADATGAAHRHSTTRRLMREFGLSPKVARLARVNRAGRRAAAVWRRRTQRKIRRLRRRGLAVAVQDEPVFVHDAVAGVKCRTPVGVPTGVPYTGSHHRAVVFGALAEGGRRPFRTHERSGAASSVRYLRGPRGRPGRVAAVPGGAPRHFARPTKAFLRSCRDIVLIRLPVGSPCPSAVEEAWRRARRALLNPGHHPTREGFRRAIAEYFRKVRCGLDIHAYLAKNAPA